MLSLEAMEITSNYVSTEDALVPAGLLEELEPSHVRQIFANTSITGNSKVHMGNAYNYYVRLANNCNHTLTTEQNAALVRKALYYCTIDDRKAQILKAKPETLNWIWNTSFGSWLEDEDEDASVYWISGKPASGKSTLMKYLITDKSSERLGNGWVLIHFFFDFTAGTDIANDRLGMVRSMILQLITKFPKHAEDVGSISELDGNLPMLTENLETVLKLIIGKLGKGIIAFVDGLDEYKSDMPEMIRYLLELSKVPKLKMCLASRPEALIYKLLSQYPGISMQDWNSRVIYSYYDVAAEGLLDEEDKERLKGKFLSIISQKANGVVLWARYVIDQIIQRAAKGETDEELQEALENVPPQLDTVYERFLDKLSSTQKMQAAVLLAILTRTQTTELPNIITLRRRFGDDAILRVELFHVLWIAGLRKDQNVSQNNVQNFRFRVHAMFEGFIEFSQGRIQRYHKTFGDYLARKQWVEKHLPVQYSSVPLHLLSGVLAADTITTASKMIQSDNVLETVHEFPYETYHLNQDRDKQLQMLKNLLHTLLPNYLHIDGLAASMEFLTYRIGDLDRVDNLTVRTCLQDSLECLLARFYPNYLWRWAKGFSQSISEGVDPSNVKYFSIQHHCLFIAAEFFALRYFQSTNYRLNIQEQRCILNLARMSSPLRVCVSHILCHVDIEQHHICLLVSGNLDEIYGENLPLWFQELRSDMNLTEDDFKDIFKAWAESDTFASNSVKHLDKIVALINTNVKKILTMALVTVITMDKNSFYIRKLDKVELLLAAEAEVTKDMEIAVESQMESRIQGERFHEDARKILERLRSSKRLSTTNVCGE